MQGDLRFSVPLLQWYDFVKLIGRTKTCTLPAAGYTRDLVPTYNVYFLDVMNVRGVLL